MGIHRHRQPSLSRIRGLAVHVPSVPTMIRGKVEW